MEEPPSDDTCINAVSVKVDSRKKSKRTKNSCRKCQMERVIYKAAALLVLIIGACAVNHFTGAVPLKTETMMTEQNNEVRRTTSNTYQHLRRDLSSDIEAKKLDDVECGAKEKSGSKLLLAAVIAGVLYMFVAIAIVCDEFFVPALEEIASENYFNLSMDVAGATLMAAGGSAPELFTSLIGTFQRSEVGFGTIVGSAVFNVLFVIGFCAISSKEILTLTWWPLARDCAYYSISLLMLAFFCGYSSPGIIEVWEALVQLGLYFGYVLFMYFNERIWGQVEKKMNEGKVSDEQNNEEKSRRSTLSHCMGKPPTLRAGLLNLFVGKLPVLDKVGVTMVTKICGDVETVFNSLNKSGDGYIDNAEFHHLVELLDSSVPSSEIDQALQELDENNDGKIDLTEFTKWYLKSERTLKAELRSTFDKFDAAKSGAIDADELRHLMKDLGAEVSEEDIKATLEEAHTNGPSDQISYDEFHEWYTGSKYWDERLSVVHACTDEIVEPISDHLKLPESGGIIAYMRWALLFPIVLLLCSTIPDVRQPGKSKFCFFSFGTSIVWIGSFTYVMVSCAEIIGASLGIPIVLMGLTILAAGTSVPDLLSSVIVARMGEGDMAVSSSIGSNIFDITVGLPLPWLLYYAVNAGGEETTITIGTSGMTFSIIYLLIMLVCIVAMIHFSGWKMTKTLGVGMLLLYFVFLAQAIVREMRSLACR